MDSSVLLAEKIRSNINVQEEVGIGSGIFSKLFGKDSEKPGQKAPFYQTMLMNFLPLVRALVIVTLFLVNGVGFSPIGCKTQYLFTPKYWYNKQLVIFFIIYFIINLGGYTITKLSDPRRQFYLSITGLIIYNILARLGEVWFAKKSVLWPGPLTYFGIVLFPLVFIYVIDDIRRYMIANYSLNTDKNSINNLKNIEIFLMISITLITIYGFGKAIMESQKIYGKNFNFILFLFGAPMALKGSKEVLTKVCSKKLFNKFDREVGYNSMNMSTEGIKALMGYFTMILLIIGSGYLIINKKNIEQYLKSKVEPLKDAKRDNRFRNEISGN